MENVPRIRERRGVFREFVDLLADCGYHVDYRGCDGADYGLAQRREACPTRLAAGSDQGARARVGEAAPESDSAMRSPGCRPLSLWRGGPSRPAASRSRVSGRSTSSGSGRPRPAARGSNGQLSCGRPAIASRAEQRSAMSTPAWSGTSQPAITTLAHNYGTGRFGHPEQDRAISLREAAMLQGFPCTYRFVPPKHAVHMTHIGRLIGNAMPPPLVGRWERPWSSMP